MYRPIQPIRTIRTIRMIHTTVSSDSYTPTIQYFFQTIRYVLYNTRDTDNYGPNSNDGRRIMMFQLILFVYLYIRGLKQIECNFYFSSIILVKTHDSMINYFIMKLQKYCLPNVTLLYLIGELPIIWQQTLFKL